MPYDYMIGIGAILLLSLVADWVGKRTALPRVTLLVLVGVAIGPYGLGWLPDALNATSEHITVFALTMIAFLLGSELSYDKLVAHGRSVLVLSVTVVIATFLTMAVGLVIIGAPLVLALVLAAVATATDPAATRDVVDEVGARGMFRDVLLGIVAIDDAWGLIVFGVTMAVVSAIGGAGGEAGWGVIGVHLGGALVIGIATGLPMALLSGRIQHGRPTQLEALGFVLVCGGIALWTDASYLLAATVAGAVVANFAPHHEHTFREIEHFEWPFVTIFFVLAGAMLDMEMVWASGVAGLGYLVLRVAGRVLGGWIGGRWANLTGRGAAWMGLALLPQAGVAVGMALLAAAALPEYGEMIVAVTIGATVLFEVLGPILTRAALSAAGATHKAPAPVR